MRLLATPKLLTLATGATTATGNTLTVNPIGGLADDSTYYLIALGGGKYKLAQTPENALAGTAITLTSQGNLGAGIEFVYTKSTPVYDTDPTNDITTDSFQFPISPGLFSYLYPQATFLGLTPVQTSNEVLNVVGGHVSLIADGGGSIGNSTAPTVVNLSGGFGGAQQCRQGPAVRRRAERRLRPPVRDLHLRGSQRGQRGQPRGAELRRREQVAARHLLRHRRGQAGDPQPRHRDQRLRPGRVQQRQLRTVQVQGGGGTLNLAAENYANTFRWTKVTANRSTDDTGTSPLTQGLVVLDKSNLGAGGDAMRNDVNVPSAPTASSRRPTATS